MKKTKKDRLLYLNLFMFFSFMLGTLWQLLGEYLFRPWWKFVLGIVCLCMVWWFLLNKAEKVVLK